MELSQFFRSVVDSDPAPIVICDTEHRIIYLNPSAALRYKKRGGYELIGRSLLDCHNETSRERITAILDWFDKSADNNSVYEFHSDKENSDVYMVALRDEKGGLIGYYEKHEYRNTETRQPYSMN